MPPQKTDQQQEQHVIASPNPAIDDSRPAAVGAGKVTAGKVEPATSTTAAPMKKATKPKRRRARTRTN